MKTLRANNNNSTKFLAKIDVKLSTIYRLALTGKDKSTSGLLCTWRSAFWAGAQLSTFQTSYFITHNVNGFINFYITGNNKTTYKLCSYKMRIIILGFLCTLQLKTTHIPMLPKKHTYECSPKQHTYHCSPTQHIYQCSPTQHIYQCSPKQHIYQCSPKQHTNAPQNSIYTNAPQNNTYTNAPQNNKLQKVLTLPKDKLSFLCMKHSPTKEITYTAVDGKQHVVKIFVLKRDEVF